MRLTASHSSLPSLNCCVAVVVVLLLTHTYTSGDQHAVHAFPMTAVGVAGGRRSSMALNAGGQHEQPTSLQRDEIGLSSRRSEGGRRSFFREAAAVTLLSFVPTALAVEDLAVEDLAMPTAEEQKKLDEVRIEHNHVFTATQESLHTPYTPFSTQIRKRRAPFSSMGTECLHT